MTVGKTVLISTSDIEPMERDRFLKAVEENPHFEAVGYCHGLQVPVEHAVAFVLINQSRDASIEDLHALIGPFLSQLEVVTATIIELDGVHRFVRNETHFLVRDCVAQFLTHQDDVAERREEIRKGLERKHAAPIPT